MLGSRGLAKLQATERWLDRWLPESDDGIKELVKSVPFQRAQLYPKQAAIVDDAARFTITEATTKAGKTMSHLEWLMDEAARQGYGNYWWIATVYKTSEMAYDRAKKRLKGYLLHKGAYKKVAEPVPPHLYKTNDTKRTIQLGGATLWFLSADRPDNLYGEDVMAAVGDEVTRWREAAWFALYTTLTATKGRAKLIGNVKGRHNWAYKLARKAEGQQEDEESEWGYHRLTAWDAVEGGVVERETIEGAREDLPEAVFKELYEAEAADDGSNPFGLEKVEQAFDRLPDGKPAPGPAVAFGVDIGEHLDFTWIVGLNEAGEMCYSERFNKVGWDEQKARIIRAVGRKPALIDATGVGDPVFADIAKKCKKAEPFKYTPGPYGTKQDLMRRLAVDFHQGGLSLYGEIMKNELLSFEYEYTRNGVLYNAPEGMHDDGVNGLALANYCLATAPAGRPRVRSMNE